MADIKLIALPVVVSSAVTDYYPLEADQGGGVFATSRITLANLATSVVTAFGSTGTGALVRAAAPTLSGTVTFTGLTTRAFTSTPTALTSANIVARTGVVRQLTYQADVNLAGTEGHGSLVQIINGRGGVFYGIRCAGSNKDAGLFSVWTGSDGGGYTETFISTQTVGGGFQHFTYTGIAGLQTSPVHALHVQGGNVRVDQINAPGACTAALVASAGNLSAGIYTYRVTFVTVEGQTTGGVTSNSVTADVSHAQVSLTGIPVSSSNFVTARKIYRVAAGGSSYLLLTTLNDNTTTTFTDNVADASLGAAMPTVNASSGYVDAMSGFMLNGSNILTQFASANLAVGVSAVATGNDTTAVGAAASATNGRCVAVGTSASATGNYATVLGWNSVSTGGVCIGGGITDGVGATIHLAGLFHNDGLSTTGHIALWTGNRDGHLYFGAAWPTGGAATGYTNYIHGVQPPSGTNGGILVLAAGLGGAATDASGSVNIQTASTGSGTTLANRVVVNKDGTVTFSCTPAAAFGTTGVGLIGSSYTQTDSTTAAAATVTAAYGSVLGAVTFATAVNAVTITDAYGLYVKDPVQGLHVTLTSKWALGADSAKLGKLYIVANTGAGICHIAQNDGTFNNYVDIQPVNGSNNVTILTNYATGNGYLGLGAGGVTPQMYINNTGVIAIGGTTSASPAFKKNSAVLAFRLADDSADASISAATGTFSGTVKTLSTTVASLPAAATAGSGARAFVTDATATTYASTVAGGGANKVPVVSDGTNWKIG